MVAQNLDAVIEQLTEIEARIAAGDKAAADLARVDSGRILLEARGNRKAIPSALQKRLSTELSLAAPNVEKRIAAAVAAGDVHTGANGLQWTESDNGKMFIATGRRQYQINIESAPIIWIDLEGHGPVASRSQMRSNAAAAKKLKAVEQFKATAEKWDSMTDDEIAVERGYAEPSEPAEPATDAGAEEPAPDDDVDNSADVSEPANRARSLRFNVTTRTESTVVNLDEPAAGAEPIIDGEIVEHLDEAAARDLDGRLRAMADQVYDDVKILALLP